MGIGEGKLILKNQIENVVKAELGEFRTLYKLFENRMREEIPKFGFLKL